MSLNWDECAVGFNVLYGTVAVAYSQNSSPFGACTAGAPPRTLGTAESLPKRQPVDHGWNYVAPSRQQPGLAIAAGKEPSLAGAEAVADSLTPAVNMLSRRQLDVLRLIVQGRSNKEIARGLNLAEGTIKIHVAALFSKLGVHRRAAVAVAGARFLSEAAPQTMTSARRASGSRPRLAPLRRRPAGGEIVVSLDGKPSRLRPAMVAGHSNSRPSVELFRRS
jgi:DNA-binding CsgD family transcriptional regulator